MKKHLDLMMAVIVLLICTFIALQIYVPSLWCPPRTIVSLDQETPFRFTGKRIHFDGQTFELGPKAFFIDGNLSDKDAKRYPYVFNSIQEAAKHITDGSEEEPMTLYIAPNVYWIDDPDDPAIRKPKEGGTPYGMVIDQSWLCFYGLTKRPENVVLACNRGQTQGAVGNFTMFRFNGDGIRCENITFGNYCNVDLVYPLKPELNRPKRMEAITQAQLVLCNSDKVVAVNCSFVSRLNSCPFVGSKRALFYDCHFECTDDALCGHGVYVGCDLDFYSSKPFWSTHGTGAAFMDCDFRLMTKGTQYLTKVGSQVALVDCRFVSEDKDIRLEWTQYPKESLRCYQYNVILNGKEVRFNGHNKPYLTVDMTDKTVLKAYRIEHQDEVIYNVYGLLRGQDDWDPLQQKELICQLSEQHQTDYASIPTQLRILCNKSEIETNLEVADLRYQAFRFSDVPVETEVSWALGNQASPFAKLRLNKDTCQLIPFNFDELPKRCLLKATTAMGLQAAADIQVKPQTLPAPPFVYAPYIVRQGNRLKVVYELALGNRQDHSLITWYRCSDAAGNNAVEVAVSRLDRPEKYYSLSRADVGYYLMAKVAPKHVRSQVGKAMTAIRTEAVRLGEVDTTAMLSTDFSNFSTRYQPDIRPGFWTVDTYKPLDTEEYEWNTQTSKTWFYGKAEGGAVGYGLLQEAKGARLLYTPVEGNYKNMSLSLLVDPCKTAGQGFGSATGQYMDVYIKFDTKTLSGYALRIVRTTKYANAVDFVLMRYRQGQTEAISEAVSSTCFRTGCRIDLKVENNRLTADVTTATPAPQHAHSLPHEVHLMADIENNNFGGTGIQHTGSTGSSATMLHELTVNWYE